MRADQLDNTDLGTLVARARRGDGEAFAKLLERVESLALSVATTVLRDPHTAADAVQDAFWTAWRKLAGLQSDQAFVPWVLRIVRNRAIDLKRRCKPERTTDPDTLDQTQPQPDVFDTLSIAEQHRRIRAAIDRLDEPSRQAVVLRYTHGLPSRQIAALLDCSPAAVDMRLKRARERLAALLGSTTGPTP